MASPPFQVEDTDEDFFDKLVDDDFGVTETTVPSDMDGVDSDEVKAFSNLSVGEVTTVSDDPTVHEIGKGEKHLKDDFVPSSDTPEKENLDQEESVSLVSSNSAVFDNVESSDRAEISSNLSTSKSSGSKITCIKEVDWSSFYADADQHRGSGFESYSDLFKGSIDNSVDPFAEVGNSSKVDSRPGSGIAENEIYDSTALLSSEKQNDVKTYTVATAQESNGQDSYNSQYWENLYPGWRYDPNTGEWHQVEISDSTVKSQVEYENVAQTTDGDVVSTQWSEASYFQQTTQSVAGTLAEGCTTGSAANWGQEGSIEYPAHMIFDPQYPDWYYDTIAQDWRSLESYTQAGESTNATQDQKTQGSNASLGGSVPETDQGMYNEYGKAETYGSQGGQSEAHDGDWSCNNVQQNTNMWQPKTTAKSDPIATFAENQHSESLYDSRVSTSNSLDQQISFKPVVSASYEQQSGCGYGGNKGGTEFWSSFPADSFSHQINQPKVESNKQMPVSHDFYGSQNSGSYSHLSGTKSSYTPKEERSPHGRPPHALVSFGFGGKLIVVKDSSSFGTSMVYESKDCVGGSVSVLDLMDVVVDKNDTSSIGFGGSDYFHALCHQSFPGPLVGGNIGNKELNTWIDERIAKCGPTNMDYRSGELLQLLLSLLKIASQHYGKLRSPFGTDSSLKENDRPESAVAKLFASSKSSASQLSGYSSYSHCLTIVPSEGQIRETAAEVQNLLVSGRTKEALQCAQEGQLWGPALILAAKLGEQHYIDTVKQMAHRQLVAGSPLRTLCLLIAGQPAYVFSAGSMTNIGGSSGALHTSQQHTQDGANGMLDDWEENLAIITANRTKGDELVILHLGDCLWKERGEITAAHICYLVAEANFDSFSDSARLCLIGADHWRCPRTYASPEAIQRTEFYEYTMVLGNSQSVLLPFQPYKLIYAFMLAEVGKVSESLKYCQAITKSLKNGRAPEVEAWKQLVSSLEERIRTHQQGGFGINLAPGKLVGKLLPFIDRSIHRMIGPPPPPTSVKNNEHDNRPPIPRVPASQSTMAMSSLMPSASMEPINEWTGDSNRRSMHNRSISEPDFGRQANSSKGGASTDTHSKASVAGGTSRFGLFGSTLIQKTMGWVSRSRPDRQAKLGEKNKFYYDEKLKRWVEEGAELPAEETAPPPPPTTAAFQNGMDYNIKHASKNGSPPGNNGGLTESRSPTRSERSSGIPPIPSSSNQFSSRGRMGVRSRYVDTFNKNAGASANLFQSPPAPVAKIGGAAKANFFVPGPSPTAFGEQAIAATGEIMQRSASPSEDLSTVMTKDTFFSSHPPPMISSASSPSMQRFASMSHIPAVNQVKDLVDNGNTSVPARSRRTASWSGSFTDANNYPPYTTELKPLGEVLGILPPSSIPNGPTMHLTRNGSSFGEELQEVEL